MGGMASALPIGPLDPYRSRFGKPARAKWSAENPLGRLSSQKRIDFCILEGVRRPDITQVGNSTASWCPVSRYRCDSVRLDRHT